MTNYPTYEEVDKIADFLVDLRIESSSKFLLIT